MIYVWMNLCKIYFKYKFKSKINCRRQKLQILTSRRIKSTSKINSSLNHLNMIKTNSSTNIITFDPPNLKPHIC